MTAPLPPAEPRHAAAPNSLPPLLDSRTLFGTAREVLIDHLGQVYRLRHTVNGKLILTK